MKTLLKKRFAILAVIVATLSSLALTACPRRSVDSTTAEAVSEDSLERMLKSGVMRVGYINYPPAVAKDPSTGELSGDFVEIARYIAAELHLKLEFHEATWSTFAPGLQTRQYDISIACTYIKVGRAANIAFSRPIAYLGNSAGVRKNDSRFANVKSPMEFDRDDLIVAVVQGESAHEFVNSHFTKLKKENLRVLSGADLSSPLALVAGGQADVGMTDAYVTKTFSAQNAEIRDVFADNAYDVSPMAWAVRPGDFRLLNFINNSIDFLESSGKLDEWRKNYKASWLVKNTQWRAD